MDKLKHLFTGVGSGVGANLLGGSGAGASNGAAGFKGKGQRLGTAEEQPKPAPKSTPPPEPEQQPTQPQRQLGIDAHLAKSSSTRTSGHPPPLCKTTSQGSARMMDHLAEMHPVNNPGADHHAPSHRPPSASMSGRVAHNSHMLPDDVQRLALDSVVMANSPTAREAAAMRSSLPLHVATSSLSESPSPGTPGMEGGGGGAHQANIPTMSTPTARETSRMGFAASEVSYKEEDYQLQHCLALVASHPQAKDSLAALSKVLVNVLSNPQEPKFRQIRLGNPKVQAVLLDVDGAVEFLQAVGFEFKFEAKASSPAGGGPGGPPSPGAASPGGGGGGGGGEEVEGYAVLPMEKSLEGLELGWEELHRVMHGVGLVTPRPSLAGGAVSASGGPGGLNLGAAEAALAELAARPPSAAGAGGGPASPPGSGGATVIGGVKMVPRPPTERNTQVVLPVAPDTNVPDWFFERTGTDVKAEYLLLQRKREDGQMLSTKSWKERAAAKAASTSAQLREACVRVRFPEGVCLQGQFGAMEPVSSVYEWVTSALRSPGTTCYELVAPSRKPLPTAGFVKDADLLPCTLLNFRVSEGKPPANVPLLSDEMLRQTCAQY